MNAPSEQSQSRTPDQKELKDQLLELCIGAKRKVLPDAMDLIDLEFAVIGGLTWRSEHCRADYGHKARLKDFNRLIKSTGSHLGINRRHVAFIFRDEPSPAGEWHVHFLIVAKGIEPVTPEHLATSLSDVWVKRFNMGTADIRVFDSKQQLSGIAYVLKVVRDDKGNEVENPPVRSKALLHLLENQNRDNLINNNNYYYYLF